MKGPSLLYDDFFTIQEDLPLIIEKIKRLLLTLPGERAGRPDYGSRLKYFLFEQSNNFERLESVLTEDIEKWIPEIIVNQVNYELNEEEHMVKVSINFTEIDTNETINYNLSL